MDLLTSYKDNCGFGLVANIKNNPSHGLLNNAITALERMMHRGAVAADGKTGDGSGMLLSMPDSFMRKIAKDNGHKLPEDYAVAMIFTQDDKNIDTFIDVCHANDMKVLFQRVVPVDIAALGEQALASLPSIVQVFVVPNTLMGSKRFEALLYLIRKETEHQFKDENELYIASFDSKVISYKGLVMPTHIKEFYKDFQDTDFEISFSLFHQRFSTNTLPQWRLAQPFRHIAHNGEINSVEANRYNVAVKSESIVSEVYSKEEINRILPIIQGSMSDSAS
ncbi:MAG: glutamate synthase large subunit, partial [Thiovulaceae bacterium]|nr:glutamate synthase large subunit [Sulfurimonadaceae bacterium]